MLRSLSVFTVILFSGSYLWASAVSLGSVVAQGQLRIDGHTVQGSGTVFDGTMVETGSESQSTADLRLSNGTRITLHNNSYGALYQDHFVLLRGEANMVTPSSFRVEVSGLVIKSSEPATSESIAIGPEGAVSVLARTGQLQIVGDNGQVLAQIRPQEKPLAFTRTEDRGWQIGKGSSRHSGDGDHDGDGDDHDHHHRHHHHSR